MKQTLSIYSKNNVVYSRGRIVAFGRDEKLGSYLTIFIRNYQANRHTSIRFYTQQDLRRKYQVGDHVKVVAHFESIILGYNMNKEKICMQFCVLDKIQAEASALSLHFGKELGFARRKAGILCFLKGQFIERKHCSGTPFFQIRITLSNQTILQLQYSHKMRCAEKIAILSQGDVVYLSAFISSNDKEDKHFETLIVEDIDSE